MSDRELLREALDAMDECYAASPEGKALCARITAHLSAPAEDVVTEDLDDFLRVARTFSDEHYMNSVVAELRRVYALLGPAEDVVAVPREPKEGLLCGDVAVSTDPRYAGFVFVRHVDGENWTTCAKMTPETWAMLDAAQQKG